MSAQITLSDDQVYELIERYLGRLASDECKEDGRVTCAYKLGAAISILGNLLELYEDADPKLTRRIFEKWRAEQTEPTP